MAKKGQKVSKKTEHVDLTNPAGPPGATASNNSQAQKGPKTCKGIKTYFGASYAGLEYSPNT